MKKKLYMCLLFTCLLVMFCAGNVFAATNSWKIGVVNHSYLNLRAKPTTASTIKLRIDGYSKIAVKRVNCRWSKAYLYQNGKSYTGYVDHSYVNLQTNDVGYVKSSTLRIRKTHSKYGKTLVVLKKNHPVYFTGKHYGYWAQVCYAKGKLGWVNEVYTKNEADNSNHLDHFGVYYVNHSYLNMRESYTTNSAITMVLGEGDKVDVLEKVGPWWYVNAYHDGFEHFGWVLSSYLRREY